MGFYCLIERTNNEPVCVYFSNVEELSLWLKELFNRAGLIGVHTIALESKILLNNSLSIIISLTAPFEKGVCLVRHNIIGELISPKRGLKRELSWYDWKTSILK